MEGIKGGGFTTWEGAALIERKMEKTC